MSTSGDSPGDNPTHGDWRGNVNAARGGGSAGCSGWSTVAGVSPSARKVTKPQASQHKGSLRFRNHVATVPGCGPPNRVRASERVSADEGTTWTRAGERWTGGGRWLAVAEAPGSQETGRSGSCGFAGAGPHCATWLGHPPQRKGQNRSCRGPSTGWQLAGGRKGPELLEASDSCHTRCRGVWRGKLASDSGRPGPRWPRL